uniref:Uncharacterized protein n=1 Tax=Arundo donax TaxID=35708 RepID=A0A0A9GWI3_ARUDO
MAKEPVFSSFFCMCLLYLRPLVPSMDFFNL